MNLIDGLDQVHFGHVHIHMYICMYVRTYMGGKQPEAKAIYNILYNVWRLKINLFLSLVCNQLYSDFGK